jgi:hypothetical protein
MITSKYSNSYDTADGSEQQFDGPARHASHDGARVPRPRLLETGTDHPLPLQPPRSSLELKVKPAWSVLSLADLNMAIRLEQWADNPAHLLRHAEEDARLKSRADAAKAERAASGRRAQLNRYRNPWETT